MRACGMHVCARYMSADQGRGGWRSALLRGERAHVQHFWGWQCHSSATSIEVAAGAMHLSKQAAPEEFSEDLQMRVSIAGGQL